MRILLVEDNARLSALIGDALKANGFAIDTAALAADAETALASTSYDAIVLDLGLPDADGMTVLTTARRRGLTAPVLILTARDGAQDTIDGLNGGADDYMHKPFAMDELVARLRALLRRPSQMLDAVIREGNMALDCAQRSVRIDGERVDLSRREFAALELLLRRNGRVVAKADMEESFYGQGEEVASNAVEVLIHRVRKKLTAAGASAEIHTLRGIGYLLTNRSS
ncbi:MAG: response regulator transcription factor [Roseiarcus sp.]|jgi:DNA-binding response OmpR family regulator